MKKITKGFFEYWLYPEQKKALSTVVMGHLVIENLLVEAIKTQLKVPCEFNPYSLSYPEKVGLCISQRIIPTNKKSAYLKLNTLRNKFSHQLNYELTFDEVFEYAKEMNLAGFCFSDDTIHKNKDSAKEMYDVELTIDEILEHLSIELILFLHDNGVVIPQ